MTPPPKPIRALVYSLSLLIVFVIWIWSRLPVRDNPQYFEFADQRAFFQIPNAQDVLSNLAFLAVGLLGLQILVRQKNTLGKTHFYLAGCLAAASVLTALGSAYFHWNPNEATLFYDRMPMTIGFTSICALLVADRVSPLWGLATALILIPAGFFTVIGWSDGWLSLKPYAALQLGSLIFLLLLSLFQPQGVVKNSVVWLGLSLYVTAKVLEVFDRQIFAGLGFVSGHTLKHLVAAAAIFIFFRFTKSKVSQA